MNKLTVSLLATALCLIAVSGCSCQGSPAPVNPGPVSEGILEEDPGDVTGAIVREKGIETWSGYWVDSGYVKNGPAWAVDNVGGELVELDWYKIAYRFTAPDKWEQGQLFLYSDDKSVFKFEPLPGSGDYVVTVDKLILYNPMPAGVTTKDEFRRNGTTFYGSSQGSGSAVTALFGETTGEFVKVKELKP